MIADLNAYLPTLSLNSLSVLTALVIAALGGWSLWRHRKYQDGFLILLGLYLMALELPLAIPALGLAWELPVP